MIRRITKPFNPLYKERTGIVRKKMSIEQIQYENMAVVNRTEVRSRFFEIFFFQKLPK
jgi:hypothetical protein